MANQLGKHSWLTQRRARLKMRSKLSMVLNLMGEHSMCSSKENSKVVHQLSTNPKKGERHMLKRNRNIMTTTDIMMTGRIIDGMIETRMFITEREGIRIAIPYQM
jgi:hypothetical protein